MNIVAWKRSRLALVVGSALLILIVLYRSTVDSGPSWGIKPDRLIGKFREAPYLTPDRVGNFEPPEEIPGDGPGEGGKPYALPESKQNEAEESIGEYGMNMVVSNAISMTRTIPDTRMEECRHWHYPEKMGLTASVVLVFHNEGFSTLMRNVHTIIKRTPKEMLKEIILVDDFSDKENLKSELDMYIEQFNGLVKIVRNKEREGLIRTRTIGAENAKGDVVVFLDAHCEVNRNWLPPLLAPIYRDRTTMTVPFIDGVDHNTFEYKPVYSPGTLFRGIWEWGMFYKETEIPKEMDDARPHKSAPYKSPTHAGGLFAIDREYFFELGAYDDGLLVWGGENFELSFKVWQCGGSIEWVPCSRVGHVYRGFMPYGFGKLAEKHKGSLITINYLRVIEVWWEDKYKEFFYARDPMARYMDYGDISKQLEMKKKLQCKPFSWFMENVAPDLLLKYPELPPNVHWGEFKNEGSQVCLDTLGRQATANMAASRCHGYGSSQLMRLNKEGQLGVGERCIDADKNVVKLIYCPMGSASGPWEFDEETKLMKHKTLDKCLIVHPTSKQVTLRECDPSNTYHAWSWKKLKPRY